MNCGEILTWMMGMMVAINSSLKTRRGRVSFEVTKLTTRSTSSDMLTKVQKFIKHGNVLEKLKIYL